MFSPFDGAMAAPACENAGEAAVIAAEAARVAKWRRESLVNSGMVLSSEGNGNPDAGTELSWMAGLVDFHPCYARMGYLDFWLAGFVFFP